jgi:hypothetical protein
MNEALILHTVEDAKHCLRNKLHIDRLLFSTHSSVDVFLKELYNIECHCLSKFLDIDDVKHFRNNVTVEVVNKVLNSLDDEISPSINKAFNLQMKFFKSLYSVMAKYQFLGYLCLSEAIKKVIDVHGFKKMLFYDYRFDCRINTSTDMRYFVSLFFPLLETEIIKYHEGKHLRLEFFKKIVTRIGSREIYILKKTRSRIKSRKKFSYKNFSPYKKTILLSEHLFDFAFLKESLNGYNILYYEADTQNPVGYRCKKSVQSIDIDFKDFKFIAEDEQPVVKIILKDIKEDFSRNVINYVNAVALLKKINEEYPILLGIWGNPPSKGTSAAIFEYLSSENIKIIGAQHGNVSGEMHNPWIFDFDFGRCDYYVSYGYTIEDLRRIHQEMKIDAKILPFGRARYIPRDNKHKKKIDILFPITDSISFFEGGVNRTLPHKLTERQIKLLEHLNSLENCDVYVKPFAFSSYKNLSVLPLFKRLKKLKLVNDVTLVEFLDKYIPNAVLIEHPSSPLIDVMHLDAEIFLMNNDLAPYDKTILEMLNRRVHYSEDVDELISKINFFLEEKLKKKRDNTYYNHYVYKEDTRENILKLIDNLVENNRSV